MPEDPKKEGVARRLLASLRTGSRLLALVLRTHPAATSALLALTLIGGVLPVAIAWVGKEIVDGVVGVHFQGAALEPVIYWVLLELGLVALQRALDRTQRLSDSLLRTSLGQVINERILEKVLSLEYSDFEDTETYDRMTRARRGASHRPLSFVLGAFETVRGAIALVSYGWLLWQLSPWALLLVVLAAVPAFVVETRDSSSSFKLFQWRAPETRRQAYLESVLSRHEHAKEVRLFGLGDLFLGRYRAIFAAHYDADRRLAIRQALIGYGVGLIGLVSFYGCYGWVAVRAARGEISFGDMTMYLMVFRQAQKAVGGVLGQVRALYEHLLYVEDLFGFLDLRSRRVASGGATAGADPSDGLRFEHVSFSYPGQSEPVLRGLDLHLPPGHKLALVGENGAGKTTLIKLMTGLYAPTEGTILLDGTPIPEWDEGALRRRIGVIFQDFARYQLIVGENIGVGDVEAIADADRWQEAAEKGAAHSMIEGLDGGYQTQLGKWFADGQELSGGQWQKIALARAFMRKDADILVLDEPTAAMDAEAEMKVFERFRALAADRMAILISHRFSTVRMADTIAVLHEGAIVERGSHEELLHQAGRYARLFHMQARGYR